MAQATAIFGDSLGFMRLMREDRVDFVLADPPYGEFPLINESIREARRISRGASAYFMYGEDLALLDEQPDRVCFWVKPVSTKNTSKNYSRFVEAIAFYDLDRSPFRQELHWSNRTGVFTDALVGKQVHPWQKPQSLIERLLRTHVLEGGSVLDPFAGICTVGHVAARLGITSTNIEIDEKWKPYWTPMGQNDHDLMRPRLDDGGCA